MVGPGTASPGSAKKVIMETIIPIIEEIGKPKKDKKIKTAPGNSGAKYIAELSSGMTAYIERTDGLSLKEASKQGKIKNHVAA